MNSARRGIGIDIGERYHSIYEYAVEGIFQSTPDGRFLSVNPAMARIFGYASPEEMIDAVGDDIEGRIYVNPTRREEFIGALLTDGVVTEFENQNYRKDGSVIWTHTNARAVRDGKGELLYFEGFLTDVSERKRAEEARREIESRFQNYVENTDAGYFYIDREGLFRRVNEAWLRMHGYTTPDEILGKHFAITQVDVDIEEATSIVKKLLEGEPIRTGEYSRRCKDGSVGYHTFSAMPVLEQGKVIGLEGFIIDTTERRRVEEALSESEDRHRDLVENLCEFICTHDLNGKILSANSWASKALGYDLEELVGKNLADFLTPESRERFPAYLQAIQKTGTNQGVLAVKTRAGETRHLGI